MDTRNQNSKSNSIYLSPDLLRAVELFINNNYIPVSGEQEISDDGGAEQWEQASPFGAGVLWKGTRVSESEEDSFFQEERIDFQDGVPVLSGIPSPVPQALKDAVEHVGETFQQRLLRLIDERGLTDAEVYKRAHIDRRLFSKIRCSENYTPRKKNVIALVLALGLSYDEAVDLLRRAGMALSPGSKSDLIVEYCIRNQIYDLNMVNALLDAFEQRLLE